jgi:hypothetical protein
MIVTVNFGHKVKHFSAMEKENGKFSEVAAGRRKKNIKKQ